MAKADEEETGTESKVEIAKRRGRQLRGTIAETLASDATHFGPDDLHLLKFHGTYQQDNRDQRKTRSEDEEIETDQQLFELNRGKYFLCPRCGRTLYPEN